LMPGSTGAFLLRIQQALWHFVRRVIAGVLCLTRRISSCSILVVSHYVVALPGQGGETETKEGQQKGQGQNEV
jgi:hypothetical protein